MENDGRMKYSQAVARLEEIMDVVQAGTLDVDSLSDVLREAGELIKFCRARLFEVDEEVTSVLDNIAECDNLSQ